MSQLQGKIENGQWSLDYVPRPQMEAFHQRTQRFAYILAHRRFGKTIATVAELIIRAIHTTKKNAQFAYICPFRSQAKAVAWQYLVDMTEGLAVEVKVSELMVKLPNGSKIFLTGSDNVNALRGLYLDGAVIDEFAQCRPELLEAVVMPCLVDRLGWLVLIGTAYGRMNQFYHYNQVSLEQPKNWFHATLKANETSIIPETELQRIRESVSEAKFNQEFLCDFSAELVGTYYAGIINQIEANGQINDSVLHDTNLPVHVAFDIGRGDSTVAWFWQERPDGLAILDCYSANGEQAQHYIDLLKTKSLTDGYRYQNVWLPHDARALTFSTKKSALEQFVEGFRNDKNVYVHIVPKLSVEDGIEAVRITLPKCHFNYANTYEGVECLRMYRKRWDSLNQVFSKQPLHDFCSDFADSFRYMAIVASPVLKAAPASRELLNSANDPYESTMQLAKLFAEREKGSKMGRLAKLRI